MASMLPILVGGPKPPPKPTARQLERARKKAQYAADGHAGVAAQLRSLGLDGQAKVHEDARDGYQKQADEAAADIKTAKR